MIQAPQSNEMRLGWGNVKDTFYKKTGDKPQAIRPTYPSFLDNLAEFVQIEMLTDLVQAEVDFLHIIFQ